MNERNTTERQSNKETVSHYDRLLDVYSKDHEVAGWGSAESQEARFKILMEIGSLSGRTVLDVGCGPGSLLGYLEDQGIVCSYVGVDINPRMIERARRQFPRGVFDSLDLLARNQKLPRVDYVLSSGVLNLRQRNQPRFVHLFVRRMYEMARVGVGFNMLSTKADFLNPSEYYAEPGQLLEFCLTLTRRVVLRHDYMPHDFTIYLYRDG